MAWSVIVAFPGDMHLKQIFTPVEFGNIILTQCFYRFFGNFDWSLANLTLR